MVTSMSKPSNAELIILQVLWRETRFSARELHDATNGSTGWSYSTTRKTLERMEAKGLVKVELVHGLKTYAAAQPKLDTMAGLIADFATKVLDLDGPLPAAAFTGSKLLDAGEVEELEALIAKHRGEGDHA